MLSEISTAYYRGDEVVLCSLDGENEVVPAEHASFFRAEDVSDTLHRSLERSVSVKSLAREGGWVRVRWTDYGTREEATKWFADRGLKVFEGDVSPIKRVLADRDVRIARPRLAYLDIESDSRLPFSRKKEMRVLMWTVVREDGKFRQGILERDTDAAEEALLGELNLVLKDFDCVTAWNGGARKDEGFDFTVLDARAKLHGCRWKPPRVLTVDAMVLWEKMNRMAAESGDEKASLSLDSLGHVVLEVGKIKTPDWVARRFGNKSLGALAWPMWEAGGDARALMAHYCWHDTDLMRRLFEKKGFFQVFFGLCQVTNCLPESRSMQTTQQMDGYLLRYGMRAGVHWPTKVYGQAAPEKFKGAFVMEPAARGVERDVHVVDFKSLYPSIMISWNMSPETMVGPDFDGPVATTPNGVRFRTDAKGILSGALELLLAGREQFKKAKKNATPGTPEWYDADARSNGYKVAANSCYGGVGSPFTRFYKPQIAEAVTQTGAWLIQTGIIAEAEKIGMRPIFSDTDSCAMQGITVERCSEFVAWCNAEKIPEMVRSCGAIDNRISIAYEKAFKILICAVDRDGKTISKTYCGKLLHYEGKPATEESEPEVKGLEYKKGDAIRLAREMQRELIELVVQKECFDLVEIERFVSAWKRRVLEEDLALEDITRSQALKMNLSEYSVKKKIDGTDAAGAAHVAVARILAARGEDVSQGTKIEYVVTDGDASPQKVVPVADFDGTFDRRYLWNAGVWPASARVLRGALPDVDWDVWLALKPRAGRYKAAPEEQGKLLLFPTGEVRIPRTRRAKDDEVLVRFQAARGNLFPRIAAACAEHPGSRPLVVELETSRSTTAVLDFGKKIRVDLTPALDRALREIGCDVLEAKS